MGEFIVTCHGWSASNWTAHALNLNPDTTCTHSARNEVASDKELQSNKNLKQHINQLQKGYVSRQNRSLDELYNEIHTKGYTSHYGSVHVLRLRDLPIIHEKFNAPSRNFNLVNVVRNPINLVWSGYGQFRDLFLYDINELHWTSGKVVRQALEFANEMARKYDLNLGEIDTLSFFGACAVLESLRMDLDAKEKISDYSYLHFQGVVQMENITSKRDAFAGMATNLGLEVTHEYLNNVFSTGVVNPHKKDKKKLTPQERYNEFLPWQKEVFNHFFAMHNLRDSYSGFGYELDFVG